MLVLTFLAELLTCVWINPLCRYSEDERCQIVRRRRLLSLTFDRAAPSCCCLSHFQWYAFWWDLACKSHIATCWFGVRLTCICGWMRARLFDKSVCLYGDFFFNQRPEKSVFANTHAYVDNALILHLSSSLCWYCSFLRLQILPHTSFLPIWVIFSTSQSLFDRKHTICLSNQLSGTYVFLSHLHLTLLTRCCCFLIFLWLEKHRFLFSNFFCEDKQFSLMKLSHRNLLSNSGFSA